MRGAETNRHLCRDTCTPLGEKGFDVSEAVMACSDQAGCLDGYQVILSKGIHLDISPSPSVLPKITR